ncbi:MAG: Flagellum-specific synthase FliI [Hyphomicrobiales bacterium]|nr:Flagellum-specific synthase FliI [Hyphomicrobiales bacterium]
MCLLNSWDRMSTRLNQINAAVQTMPLALSGQLEQVKGALIEARVPNGEIGHLCLLMEPATGLRGRAEIVGLSGQTALLAPLGHMTGLSRRIEIISSRQQPQFAVSDNSLGCVLDWNGRVQSRFAGSADHQEPVSFLDLRTEPPLADKRKPIATIFKTGIRTIDGLLTLGEGQRIGVYGNAGAGKSTLLEQIATGADADVIVVGLIGERSREVVELVERLQYRENASRICIIAATSDRPPAERLNAAFAATACAQHFQDKGLRVLLIMDSVTRVARALREIGLARGEPSTRRGFPPSVFESLPSLFERAGCFQSGSITALYTILVEGEIIDDPIAEETMSLLDGHIILSKTIAARGIYPAIDVLKSLSRSMKQIVSEERLQATTTFRALVNAREDIDMLIRVGEYQSGHDEFTDRSIAAEPAMKAFLSQSDKSCEFEDTLQSLYEIAT